MKNLKLLAIGAVLFLSNAMSAQTSININIGSPPQWGPMGYDNVRYYYLPDVEAYYDINSSMFIYYQGGGWIHMAYLPQQYRGYDLYGGYKVVMTDYRGNRPYVHFAEYKRKYAKGYRGNSQKTIGHKPGNGNSKSKGFSNGAPSQKKGGNVSKGNGSKGNGGKGGGQRKNK